MQVHVRRCDIFFYGIYFLFLRLGDILCITKIISSRGILLNAMFYFYSEVFTSNVLPYISVVCMLVCNFIYCEKKMSHRVDNWILPFEISLKDNKTIINAITSCFTV